MPVEYKAACGPGSCLDAIRGNCLDELCYLTQVVSTESNTICLGSMVKRNDLRMTLMISGANTKAQQFFFGEDL